MNKLLPLILIFLVFAAAKAQTATKKTFPVGARCSSVMAELTDLHKQTLKLFNEKKYDEAYPLAKKMSEIAEANCVEEKDKRLRLAVNVADLQIKRGKKDEGREIYDRNLTLAAEVHGEDSPEFNDYLDALMKLSINAVSNEKFEQYALKSVEVKKKVFGAESYETARELLKTAIFYRRLKKFETAEPYYLEAVAVGEKNPTDEKIWKLSIANQYRAYLLDRYGEKEGAVKSDEFMKNRYQRAPETERPNIVNGMATNLVKPGYSSQAFVLNAKGKVEVEVEIGEDGKVISAKAITGHPLLRPSSEQAAKASTFLPTYIQGKAVRVKGIIVYNFD